jgi:hypothetical protein
VTKVPSDRVVTGLCCVNAVVVLVSPREVDTSVATLVVDVVVTVNTEVITVPSGAMVVVVVVVEVVVISNVAVRIDEPSS